MYGSNISLSNVLEDCKPGSYEVGLTCELCDIGEYQPVGRKPACDKCPNDEKGIPKTTLGTGKALEEDCVSKWY